MNAYLRLFCAPPNPSLKSQTDTRTHTHTHTYCPWPGQSSRVSSRAACTAAHLCYLSTSLSAGSRGRGGADYRRDREAHIQPPTPCLCFGFPYQHLHRTHTHTPHCLQSPALLAWISAEVDTWQDKERTQPMHTFKVIHKSITETDNCVSKFRT